MSQENNKLGRGLSSLFSSSNNYEKENLKHINISQIIPNKDQPRKKFNQKELDELSESIKTQGILQPIVVRKKSDNSFEIIAGERRWRAAQIAGLHEVPTIVKQLSDSQVIQAALIENIQRENLNPVEEAKAYKSILSSNEISSENLSKIIGKSRSHISNIVRLLELDTKILEFIESGKLSMGHARALIGVPDAINLAKEIIDKKLSVRDAEKNTSKYKKSKNLNKTSKNNKDPNIIDLEKELSEKIGLKTSIQFNDQGSSGSITLFYSDLDQLDEIMKRLKR
tara:strand:- start:275 stop:1123 length:849 start_codon:yes stop_codon:yes gene_type:complete